MDTITLRRQSAFVEKNLREGMECLLKLSVSIEAQRKELEIEKRHWSDLQSKMQENAKNAREMITPDVGGTLFRTTKSTLLKMDGSYFHAMLASGDWLPNEMGMYMYYY
jgi:hypothetical protein